MADTSRQIASVDKVVDSIREAQRPEDERRLIYAKGENTRHIRHDQILERWPILPEPWARRIEDNRLAAVDRTPGQATFGR
jgi:hypothetical protein